MMLHDVVEACAIVRHQGAVGGEGTVVSLTRVVRVFHATELRSVPLIMKPNTLNASCRCIDGFLHPR